MQHKQELAERSACVSSLTIGRSSQASYVQPKLLPEPKIRPQS